MAGATRARLRRDAASRAQMAGRSVGGRVCSKGAVNSEAPRSRLEQLGKADVQRYRDPEDRIHRCVRFTALDLTD
jgi:hypothetical protein